MEIYFRNGTEESDVYDLTERICGSTPCTLDKLEDAWREVIPLDWDAECHNMDPSPEGLVQAQRQNTILGVLLGLSWVLFAGYVFFTRPRRKESDQMQLINSEFSMAISGDDTKTPWQNVPS